MPIDLPQFMTCIEIPEPGGPDALKPASRPLPRPGDNEILLKVDAAAINRPDLMQRAGHYPPPPGASDIPGLDVAGRVCALGPGVAGWKEGDRVTALVSGGGYAEYCVVPAPQALPFPRGMEAIEAAAIPETFFTVWTNLFVRAQLQPDETVLVHGGASGIGTAAIALASNLGSRVIATAGTEDKCRACRQLGAALAINYKEQDFAEEVSRFTDGKGVQVILDMVAGKYLARNIDCLATDGRLSIIAALGGAKAEINLAKIMQKRITLTGSTLRARSVAFKGEIAAALRARVWPLLEDGRIKPVIHATFPLAQANEAHRALEEGGHIGKIVLTVP